MKEIAFLSVALLGAASFAATPAEMTFSYGADMTPRHEQTSPVKIVGSYVVPRVGDGMPMSDTVAMTRIVLADMPEIPAEDWKSETADCATGSQAALCIKEKEDLSLAWMGYSNGAWVELAGVTPVAGAWEVKMDFDYTQGTTLVRVRYSVRQCGSAGDYVALQPAGASSPWLETPRAENRRITSVEMSGWCDLASATAESGQRQCYAETTTVEDYRMDNSGVTLEVAVGKERWCADTLVATVMDSDGKKVGEVSKPLSEAQDGRIRLELPGLAKGRSFTYELKLTGRYSGADLVCEKGGGTVVLPEKVAEATVGDDGKIVLSANAELDLSTSSLADGAVCTVQNPQGKKFHLRWKDAANSWATKSGDALTVHAGTPANGLKSFASYALGLDPTKELAKPAAVVKPGGMQSESGVTVHVPNVTAANLPDSGVEVIHRLQRSDDKGANWSDTDVSAGPGESLVVPFENGVLFRVNTVLK